MAFRILYLRKTPCDPEARAALCTAGQVDERILSRAELMAAIGEYDALLIDLEHQFDGELLSRAARLKVLTTATTGLDHIDLESCRRRGIEVVSLKEGAQVLDSISATAELTWGLVLCVVRRLPAAMRSVLTEGRWAREAFRTYELQGKVIGIIGCGRLGRMVARYGLAFGMDVVACDPHVCDPPEGVRLCEQPELLDRSDVVSLHVRLTDGTKGLFGREQFAAMKEGAWLVNTSRGALVDEGALLDALETGRLRGAALDVLCDEEAGEHDWVARNALVQYAQQHDNLIITPHIGGATIDSKRKVNVFMARRLCEALERHRH